MATYKYAKYTLGQIEAVFNQLGGEDAVDALLRGDKGAKVEDVIIKLFDKNGRRIPPHNLRANVCDPNRNFHIVQPNIVLADRFNRLVETLGIESQGCSIGMSGLDFEKEVALTKDVFKANELLKTLGEGYPILLPQMDLTADYGTILETTVLPAVKRAYTKEFKKFMGGRKFANYRNGDLAGKVTIIEGVRHERIIERLKHGPVIGLCFPVALQGYSVQAQREQMATLPEQFSLAGVETLFAAMMYPDVMARDYNTPGYDLSALQWQELDCSLDFWALDDRLEFDARALLGHAYGHCSGGLLFVR